MRRRILITGGTGTLGHGFQALAKNRPEIEFLFWGFSDCDLTNLEETIAKIGVLQPDAIIHIAALSGGIGLTSDFPATVMRSNLQMDISILEAARAHNIKKVVMSLSVGIYSPDAELPLREKNIHEGKPHVSAESYAFAKRMVDPLIRAYRQEYDMSVVGVIPNGIFGPHDHFHEREGTMLASLVERFYVNRDNDVPLIVWGDGTPLREYTYSEDMAAAYLWVLDHYDEDLVLNIGSNEECSVAEIVKMIAKVMEIPADRIQFDTSKPKGVYRRPTDNSIFVGLSGFKYRPVSEGIETTVRWYMDIKEHAPEMLRTKSKILS